MNRKERFLAALNLQQPDRVSLFDFLFQRPLYEALIGHKPEGYNGEDAVKCARAFGHCGVWLYPGLGPFAARRHFDREHPAHV